MRVLLLFVFISLIALTAYQQSQGIPAFARQYSLSCQTCHSPAPRLKPYGDEFAGAGFTLTDKESPRYYQETGDESLSLLRNFPLAVRLDLAASYNVSNKETPDFGTPYIIKLLSGGAITKNISYYFYFMFSERGEIAGVEDAYIMFNDLFGIDLDIYIGQFQISDPLFKRELRLTMEDYYVYKTNVGISRVNMTYDRGIMMTLGLETGTDIIFEIVNGNGIGPAGDNKIFDNDKHKFYLARISQEVADFFRVGGVIYAGGQNLKNNLGITTAEIMMFGPDASFALGDIAELNLQYMLRTDNKTFLTMDDAEPSGKIETRGGLAELIITPNGDRGKPYGSLLANYIESDDKALDYQSLTAHAGYLIKRNIRIFAEFTYCNTQVYGNFGKFNIGIVSGF